MKDASARTPRNYPFLPIVPIFGLEATAPKKQEKKSSAGQDKILNPQFAVFLAPARIQTA